MMKRGEEGQNFVSLRMHPKILFLFSDDRFFWSHRLPIARAALREGYEVVLATAVYSYAQQIQEEGFRLIPLNMRRKAGSLLTEINAVRQMRAIYRSEQPKVLHHVAIKAVLYGAVASLGRTETPVINALTGLGYLAASTSRKAAMLRFIVWNAFKFFLRRRNQWALVENQQDKELLVKQLKIPEERVLVTRGSGVNIEAFAPSPEPEGVPVIVLASRMLRIKGIYEFVESARLLKQRGLACRFVLVGDSDPNNPSCIAQEELQEWHNSGVIEWWGHHQDMPEIFKRASIVCLPSHGGEGVPKVLMEAAASGKPIITTDVPGCREIVHDGLNGLLVPAKNVTVLADAMQKLAVDRDLRCQMGTRSREIAVQEFSEDEVIRQTLNLYRQVLGPRAPSSVAVSSNVSAESH